MDRATAPPNLLKSNYMCPYTQCIEQKAHYIIYVIKHDLKKKVLGMGIGKIYSRPLS